MSKTRDVDNLTKHTTTRTSKARINIDRHTSKTYSFYQVYSPYTTYSIYFIHDPNMSIKQQNRLLKLQVEDFKTENEKLANYAKRQTDMINKLLLDNEKLKQDNMQLNSLLDREGKQMTASDDRQLRSQAEEDQEHHVKSFQSTATNTMTIHEPNMHRQHYKRWVKSHQMSKRNKQRDKLDQ